MAEDFTLEVEVAGNFTKLREGMAAELASIQKQGITVPVTAGGSAPGSIPPAAMPATVDAAAQQAMVRAVAAQPTRTPLLAAAQAAAQAGLPAFFGTGGMIGGGGQLLGGGPQTINIPNAAAVAAGTLSGGVIAPQQVPTYGRTLADLVVPPESGGRGQGRGTGVGGLGLISGMYAVHIASRVAMAEMQHSREIRDAEGDPHAMIRADIQYRDRVAQAVPGGSLVLAAKEYFTHEEEDTSRALRSADQMDKIFGQRRERGFTERGLASGRGFSAAIEQTRITYDRATQELRERQAGISSEIRQMYPGQPGVSEKLAEVTELGRQMETAGRQQKHDQAQLMADQALARAGLQAAAANYSDIAGSRMSPIQMDRAAMLRRQALEVAKQQKDDPSLIPDLKKAQQGEREAFDVQTARNEKVRDVETDTAVAVGSLIEKNRPFEARQWAAYGRMSAAWEKAKGDSAERSRIRRDYTAEMGAIQAEEVRRRDVEGIQTTGETEALMYGIARNPYMAGLRRIASERDAAVAAAPKDNPDQIARIREQANQKAFDFTQRFQDARTLTGMGLNTQERVTGIMADSKTPWGERQAQAAAAGIVGQTQQQAESFEQQGEHGFAAQTRQIGVNKLRAESEALRHSLHVEEIESINRVDLSSGSNIARQFAAFRAGERDLGGGGGGGGGGQGGGGSMDDKTWRDSVLRALEKMADSHGGVGP